MFGALWDAEDGARGNSIASDAAAPVAVVAADAGLVETLPRRRLHLREGEQLGPTSGGRLAMHQAKSAKARWKEKAIAFAKQLTPSFASHVARICFRKHSPIANLVLHGANGDAVSIPSCHDRKKRTYEYYKCQDFGLCSAVAAQARGLASFVADDDDSVTTTVITINTLDDASMWLRDPAPAADRQNGTRSEGGTHQWKALAAW